MNRKTKVQELEETTNAEPKAKSSVRRTARNSKSSKPIKETVENSLNASKEALKENIGELKDDAVDAAAVVSKTTAKTVKKVSQSAKKVSENAKKTITKTSDDLVKAVKTNISNLIGFDKKLYIEYKGVQVSEDELIDRFKSEWTKTHDLSEIKDLKVYYKIEEDTAYYLVNDTETIAIKII